MAELVVTQDELALRRRARRRLVGAVAIALTAFVVLPMLFDSEPKPLGPEVDIRIPAQDSPFEAAPPVKPAVQSDLNVKPAEPTQPPASQATDAPAPPTLPNTASPSTVTPSAGAAAKPGAEIAKADPAVDRKMDATKPEKKSPVVAIPAVEKPKLKPEQKPEAETKAKLNAKPDASFATQGYFLQLGAFGSETNARQLQDKALAAGFKVAMTGTNGQFRVRVGPIPQHERALEIQAKLKAKGFSPVLLGP
jgi:DedD protein